MELPNNGYGYWVRLIRTEPGDVMLGPLASYDSAERCLIAAAARHDIHHGLIQLGTQTADGFTAHEQVPTTQSSGNEVRRASTSRR